jgi:hypothetical protein
MKKKFSQLSVHEKINFLSNYYNSLNRVLFHELGILNFLSCRYIQNFELSPFLYNHLK